MLAMVIRLTLGSCSNDDYPVNPPQPTDGIPAVVKNLPGTEVWETPVDYSDFFETFSSDSFHEYLPVDSESETTLLSTATKPGVPYQLVVTNSAGLYRYVTDHIVCIQESQMDKILFTIY